MESTKEMFCSRNDNVCMLLLPLKPFERGKRGAEEEQVTKEERRVVVVVCACVCVCVCDAQNWNIATLALISALGDSKSHMDSERTQTKGIQTNKAHA